MAKTVSKKSETNKSTKPAAPKATKPLAIEKVSEQVLNKLQSLNIEAGLQADIQWCLGSYRYDKNPVGLYEMGYKALPVLKAAAEKNKKSVSAKLITDLEKALKDK
ncbi:MAG: hypothetical protein L6Q51_13670 [Cyclobacteriaceae bacterium]|nr:hypothetical protein [Cyclobacteriaceae bacterium]